jgi:hypothetical protein
MKATIFLISIVYHVWKRLQVCEPRKFQKRFLAKVQKYMQIANLSIVCNTDTKNVESIHNIYQDILDLNSQKY